MKGSKLLATLLLSAMLFAGCGAKDQTAVIKVNDQVITQEQFDKALDEGLAQSPFGSMPGVKDNKDGFFYLMTAQNTVNQLIIQELLAQEASSRDIKVEKADLEDAMEKMVDQVGGKNNLMKILRDNGISASKFKKDLEKQILLQKLAESVNKSKVTDKECEAFYKKNPEKFKHGEQVRALHILIKANENQLVEEIQSNSKDEISEDKLKELVNKKMEEKKAKAEKILAELKADPTKFEKLARKYSEDEASAKQGGDLGFFTKDKMVPEFAKVAFETKPNTISDVVKTQFGYHIIMPVDRMEAGTIPFEKAKERIRAYLTQEKQTKALEDLTTTAKKNAKIEYLDESYNPDEMQKKLNVQMDAMTGGQASKIKEASKKEKAKK